MHVFVNCNLSCIEFCSALLHRSMLSLSCVLLPASWLSIDLDLFKHQAAWFARGRVQLLLGGRGTSMKNAVSRPEAEHESLDGVQLCVSCSKDVGDAAIECGKCGGQLVHSAEFTFRPPIESHLYNHGV